MCQACIKRWREEHAEGMRLATEHMDAQGIPEDSIVRGFANIQIACSANPGLNQFMTEMYPTPEQLVS